MPDVTDQTGIHVAATDGMVVLTCRSETVKTTAPMTPAAAEVIATGLITAARIAREQLMRPPT